MLLTIHNLPAVTRYADIKSLLQSKCGLQQVILDNLVGEGEGKKVTVGVAEDADAAILVRKINGLYWNGQQLYVEDVRQQKNASEQPYRSAAPMHQETDQSFRSMNLQQHSSYPQASMPIAPAVQPMMPMYYVPDYTNYEYPKATGVQPNYVQNQNYDQTQNVQNAYMGIGDVQTSQMPQAGAQYKQDFSGPDQNPSSWVSYNNEEDFVGKMPHYEQNSPGRKREGDWIPNRRESPPRGDHGQPWAGRGPRPANPDYRPNRPDERPGFKKPRPDFRPNNPPGLLSLPAPEFSDNNHGRLNQFSGPREFPNKRPDRPDQRERFADRSNDFGQNTRRGPNEFSGWPNERRGNNELAGRQNEFSGRPNEFSGRPNERRGNNELAGRQSEFSGRPNEFSGRPNEFSGRPNERRGNNELAGKQNEFSGRPNEFSGRPNERRGNNELAGRQSEFSGRPNEFSGRPNEFSGRPNERRGNNELAGRQNEFSGRPNKFSGRPNEFSGRPNERRGPNEFAGGRNERGRPDELSKRSNERRGPNHFSERPNERQRRPDDRPGLSKSNREYGRSNERDEFNQPIGRAEFSRRDKTERHYSRPDSDTRKRKFDERFNEAEHPERISRPRPSRSFNYSQPSRRMFINASKRIIYVMKKNLDIGVLDVATRDTLRQLISDRLESVIDGKTITRPQDYYELYRSVYPEIDDTTTYDTVLDMVSKTPQIGTADAEKPKPVVAKPMPPPKMAKVGREDPVQPKPDEEAKSLLPRKITKGEREILRRQKEAQDLLAQGKLPSFPEGDKRKVAQQRKEEKEGYIPEVDAPYKTAMEEEIKRVTDLFIHELDNAPTAAQQRAYNTVNRAHLVEEMVQHLTQNLARRISNTGLKVVRIYGSPKLPTRAVLEKALFNLGVQSLRKSTKTKMYTAALDSYDRVDELCAMESLQVADNFTITFKPFHMALKEKADLKVLNKMRKKLIDDMIDKTELDLLDKDWPAREAEIQAEQEVEAAKEAKAAKDTKADLEDEAKLQDAEKVELNDTVPEHDLTKSDELNDFQVIDEVNEDSDVEFTSAVVEEIDLNSENNGNGEDNNGYGDENNDDVGNNDNDECFELDGTRDEGDNEFDADNVDVDINDIDEDDLEDY